jgi:DIRP
MNHRQGSAASTEMTTTTGEEEKEYDSPGVVLGVVTAESAVKHLYRQEGEQEVEVDADPKEANCESQQDMEEGDDEEDNEDDRVDEAYSLDSAEVYLQTKGGQNEEAKQPRSQAAPMIPRMLNSVDDDTGSVRTTQSSDDQVPPEDGEETKSGSSVPSHLPDYLDRSTVKRIRSYLIDFGASNDAGYLQEDEIYQLMIKADRNVEHRARYYSNPLDDLVDEEKMYKDFYKEEEEYLVGHDFMKEMTFKIQQTKRGAMDKRTLNWVKRAAGLKRKDYHSPHAAVGRDDEESDDNEGTRKAPRRYTRGMARNTRIKKKEEFMFMDSLGLKSLLDAVEEMEPTSGPYPVPFECLQNRDKRPSPEGKRPGSSRARDDDDDDESSVVDKRSTFDPTVMRPLVARIPEEDATKGLARGASFIFGDHRDFLVTKVLVNGDHVEEDEEDRMSLKERKRELKRLRDRQYQKRRRDRKIALQEQGRQRPMLSTPIRSNSKGRRDYDSGSDDDGPRLRKIPTMRAGKKGSSRKAFSGSLTGARPLRGPVSLPLLDWQRRQLWSPRRRTKKEAELEANRNMQIPDHFKTSGISFRLPPWEALNPALTMPEEVEPVRKRHADDVYAAWCHKLINCLNGSARSWAIHEFFYSDLDRPWYSSNTFAKEAAKLGIPPAAKLTRGDWGVVRRTIRRRPRRFSKKFILSQLKERNEFRNIVRQLQRNPDEANRTGYAIPAPIRVGATVTAYNKRFLILHRGVVLFHDAVNARFLVQFERSELGFQFCSDTEVASHGVPNVLMPPATRQLCPSPYKASTGSFLETGEMPYGTSHRPIPGNCSAP